MEGTKHLSLTVSSALLGHTTPRPLRLGSQGMPGNLVKRHPAWSARRSPLSLLSRLPGPTAEAARRALLPTMYIQSASDSRTLVGGLARFRAGRSGPTFWTGPLTCAAQHG
jgi:hypothetical protein